MALLEKDVFFFTTFGGETLSLAASIACINFIRKNDVVAHIDQLGRVLLEGVNKIVSELSMDYISVIGYPFRTAMNFAAYRADPFEMKTLVQQEMLRRGILWSGFHNLCYAHSREDIDYILGAYAEVMPHLKAAVKKGDIKAQLKGETLQPVFRPSGLSDKKNK